MLNDPGQIVIIVGPWYTHTSIIPGFQVSLEHLNLVFEDGVVVNCLANSPQNKMDSACA